MTKFLAALMIDVIPLFFGHVPLEIVLFVVLVYIADEWSVIVDPADSLLLIQPLTDPVTSVQEVCCYVSTAWSVTF